MALTALSWHCVITGCFLMLLGFIHIVMEMTVMYRARISEKAGNTTTKLDYATEEEYFLAPPEEDEIDYTRWNSKSIGIIGTGTIITILMITGVIKRRVILLAPFYLLLIAVIPFAAYYITVMMFMFSLRISMNDSNLLALYYVGLAGAIYIICNPFVAVFREIRQEQSEKRKQSVRV